MTIDERLDRLTERHEALTQSIELVIADHRAMIEGQRSLTRDIEALKVAAQQDAENIRALARIAEIHERRSHLEGQE